MINNYKQKALKNGLFLGVFWILSTSYIYFVDLKLMTNVWFGVITIILCVIFGIISILQLKANSAGLITFKEAFSVYFYTLIVGSVMNCIFVIILFQFVFSAEQIQIIKDTLTNFNLYIMKLNYATADEITKAQTYSDKMNPSDVLPIISSSIKYLLRDCLVGLLIALIFRNKRSL